MGTWLDDRVTEIRQRLSRDDEGSLWVLFFHDPEAEPVIAMAIDGAMSHMDQLMTRNLASIIDEVPASAALLAVPRLDGSPGGAERRLWRDLEPRFRDQSTRLLDLVVVGCDRYWSARTEEELCPTG